MNNSFETVARFNTEAEAQLLVLRLRDAGIASHVANRNLRGLAGATPFSAATIWVQVAPEDFSQAEEIALSRLPDLAEDELADLDAAADALAACPACGADSPEYSEDGGGIVGVCLACGHTWRL